MILGQLRPSADSINRTEVKWWFDCGEFLHAILMKETGRVQQSKRLF